MFGMSNISIDTFHRLTARYLLLDTWDQAQTLKEEDEGVSHLGRRLDQNIATSLHLDDRTEANGEDRVNLLSSLHQLLVV